MFISVDAASSSQTFIWRTADIYKEVCKSVFIALFIIRKNQKHLNIQQKTD